MKTLAPTHPDVKNSHRAQTGRRSPILGSAAVAVVVAVLVLELSTGCRTSSGGLLGNGRAAGLSPQPGLVFITILMIVVGLLLLLQVGRIVGEIFTLATKLASAFTSVLLVLAIAAGAVIVGLFALATG